MKKKKTFNVQHDGRVREEPRTYHVREAKGKTSNFQPSQENSAPSREKPYDLEDRLLEYAVRVMRLVDALPSTKAGRHVADQLLRCGTLPLANHGELHGAESR